MVLPIRCDTPAWHLTGRDELDSMDRGTEIQPIRVVRRVGEKQRTRPDPSSSVAYESVGNNALGLVQRVHPPRQKSSPVIDQGMKLVALGESRDASPDMCIGVLGVFADLQRLAVDYQRGRRLLVLLQHVDESTSLLQHLRAT